MNWPATLVLVAALLALGTIIFVSIRRFRGRKVTFAEWLAALPQGSFKVLVAAVMALIVTIGVTAAPLTEALLCMARWQWFRNVPATVACTHLEVHEGGLYAIVAIIGIFVTGSSVDFRSKRQNFIPGEDRQDIEHAAAQRLPAPNANAAAVRKSGGVAVVAETPTTKDGRTLAEDDPHRGEDDEGNAL